jgi:hypothetical protein
MAGNPYDDIGEGSLELADLGGGGAPAFNAGEEGSFADAQLDGLEGSEAQEGGYGEVAGVEAPKDEIGSLELDVPGAGPKGSTQTRSLAAKKESKPAQAVPDAPALQSRGATSVGAMVPTGASPAGHKHRRQGLFFPDTLENVLACMVVGLLVGLFPARLVSASHLDSVGVDAALDSMEEGHRAIDVLLDPERVDEGPQLVEAVETALNDEIRALDQTAAEVETAIASAKSRYWMVWGGIGLPLGLALTFLRRR